MIRTGNPLARKFGIFGAPPRFARPLPVGQMNFPSWERYEAAMREIFDREWYTNHGPLAQEAEHRLAAFLGVRNVICVSNATVGLMMAVKALGVEGDIVVPAFTFPATVQALVWAGARPRFCDVDRRDHQITADTVAAVLDRDVQGVLGVNIWGDACEIDSLTALADERGVALWFDSAQAFGCHLGEVPLGRFGRLEVFSFHATKVLNAAEGGCVATDDDDLAARLRNVRSSYGAGAPVTVPITANGRFSEAQAALTLLSLEDYPLNRERNRRLLDCYDQALAAIPGVHLRKPRRVSESNCQYAVCEVDEREFGLPRDSLLAVLRAENVLARRYFYPGVHRSPPFGDHAATALRVTDELCNVVIQLPTGAMVTEDAVEAIGELVRRAHEAAPALSEALARGHGGSARAEALGDDGRQAGA